MSIIDEELAKEFLVDSDNVDLSKATEITDEAAEALSGYDGGELYLYGLIQLSDAAAISLSKFRGELWLKGITELSDASVEALSKVQGSLQLSALPKLSDAAAESLSRHEGGLYLDGLVELTDNAARSLSKRQVGLSPHIEKLDIRDVEEWVTQFLPKNPTKAVYQDLLGGNQCSLSLDGLTELSDAAAESLSNHKGRLNLDGLTKLSDAAAESLSNHKGFVDVIEIRTRSFGALEISHDHRTPGMLCLGGVTKLSDVAAEAISKHKGSLFLGVTELSDAAAESLSAHEGELNLRGLGAYGLTAGVRKVSTAAAEHLSKKKGTIGGVDSRDWVEARPVKKAAKKKAAKKKAAKKKAAKGKNLLSNKKVIDALEDRGAIFSEMKTNKRGFLEFLREHFYHLADTIADECASSKKESVGKISFSSVCDFVVSPRTDLEEISRSVPAGKHSRPYGMQASHTCEFVATGKLFPDSEPACNVLKYGLVEQARSFSCNTGYTQAKTKKAIKALAAIYGETVKYAVDEKQVGYVDFFDLGQFIVEDGRVGFRTLSELNMNT